MNFLSFISLTFLVFEIWLGISLLAYNPSNTPSDLGILIGGGLFLLLNLTILPLLMIASLIGRIRSRKDEKASRKFLVSLIINLVSGTIFAVALLFLSK